jgi:putative transposase
VAVIARVAWLNFRLPLSLRMVEDPIVARGIIVSRETVWRWTGKFGRELANKVRRRAPQLGDTWHLGEAAVAINGKKHWLWRATNQDGS